MGPLTSKGKTEVRSCAPAEKAHSLFQNNNVHNSNLDKAFLCSFFRLGCWIQDPCSRLDQHPAKREQPLEATG